MIARISKRPSLASLLSVSVFSLVLPLSSASTMGQGLDDLFSQPGDAIFADFDESPEPSPVRVAMQSRPENRAEHFAVELPASQTVDAPLRSASDLKLVDSPGSRPGAHRPTAMDLRQARALAESQARTARLEAARWGLRPTLRPTWASDSMAASQFSHRQTYIVPVYVLSR